MDTLSQSDFMTQFRECIMQCSEKKGHEYKYVNVINEWYNQTFIKIMQMIHIIIFYLILTKMMIKILIFIF